MISEKKGVLLASTWSGQKEPINSIVFFVYGVGSVTFQFTAEF